LNQKSEECSALALELAAAYVESEIRNGVYVRYYDGTGTLVDRVAEPNLPCMTCSTRVLREGYGSYRSYRAIPVKNMWK
jgi:hypothetical protein